jgi:arabinan endo-1,5-alpha-L-arabinosidase
MPASPDHLRLGASGLRAADQEVPVQGDIRQLRSNATRSLLGVLLAVGAIWSGASPAAASFPNPMLTVGDMKGHDPSLVIRPTEVRYAIYSTDNESRFSPDRTTWAVGGPFLPLTPAWWKPYSPDGNVWAPDVSYHDGQFWMYYAVSTFFSQKSAIGLATSLTGDPGSWTDHGLVIDSAPGDAYNAIDPNLLVDTGGNWWLSFGSWSDGIFMVSLDPTTGKPTSANPPVTNIAARPSVPDHAIEAPFIFHHGSYYYLFVSFDHCCQGINSDYSIHVGRSTSPTGPYVDQAGVNMLSGGGTTVLATHDGVIGPGGQSVVHDVKDGRDLLVYHYYIDAPSYGAQNWIGLNFLNFDGAGWPYVAGS